MTLPGSKTLCAALLAALAAAGLSACSMIAWPVEAFAPPRKVAAKFKLPPGKKVLVFVDDVLQPVGYEPIKSDLTARLNDELLKNHVAGATIPYRLLSDMITARRDFNTLSIGEVGRELGADIVLHVRIDRFTLRDEAAAAVWHGQLQVSVRLVDVENGWADHSLARMWPKDSLAGHLMSAIDTPASVETSPTHGEELSRTLAASAADQIAKLFYDHKEKASSLVPDR